MIKRTQPYECLPCLWILIIAGFVAVFCPGAAAAEKPLGYKIMFRPQTIDLETELPRQLAAKYPHHSLVVITFQPATHAPAKDGSNLGAGEGSWLDRGMRPSEPGKIHLLLPEDDAMLVHTLKVSEGPFIFKVINSGQGYLETVPLVSPKLEVVPEKAAPERPHAKGSPSARRCFPIFRRRRIRRSAAAWSNGKPPSWCLSSPCGPTSNRTWEITHDWRCDFHLVEHTFSQPEAVPGPFKFVDQ